MKGDRKVLPSGEDLGGVSSRPIDKYFAKYAESHQDDTNKTIHWICVPLIVFSLLGLIWAIPFPHLAFLGQYNGFVNWASFLIAFVIYYYYRLSPILSYAMLLVLFVFCAAITGLENLEQSGWIPMWQVCIAIFTLAWVGQFIGHKIEGEKPSFIDDLKFLLIGPLWLMHFIFRKAGIPY
jgi:uncharacterized membrane protein YGL010W